MVQLATGTLHRVPPGRGVPADRPGRARAWPVRLEVIPDAGHLSNAENPTAFTAAVRRFIAASESKR
jgi:pimeloyl-ACP methyl ester carboxylesterase